MDDIQVKEEENILFKTLAGSHLYGTFDENSDWDYVSVVIPPIDSLIGINNFNRTQKFFNEGDKEIDLIVYSLRRFIELIIKGDPRNTETLFSKNYYCKNENIDNLLDILRKEVISNIFYKKILGFSNSQWRKALAITKTYKEKPVKQRLKTFNKLVSICNLTKEEQQQIKKIIGEKIKPKIISSYENINAKRQEEIDKYGYCTKNAMHSIRLLEELEELLITGNITFPRPNADFLLNIKKGEIPKNEIEKRYYDVKLKAEKSIEKSVLNNKPNTKRIWNCYKEIILQVIKK